MNDKKKLDGFNCSSITNDDIYTFGPIIVNETAYNSYFKTIDANEGVTLKTVDVKCENTKSIVHGHWIGRDKTFMPLDKHGNITDSCWCSVCGDWLTGSDEYSCKGNYCPNCGAKMDEKKENVNV